jgi:Ring hydroxylating beta subunit
MSFPAEWYAAVSQRIFEGFDLVDSGHATKGAELVDEGFTMTVGSHELDREKYIGLMSQREQADYSTRHCVANIRLVERTDAGVRVAFTVAAHRYTPGKEGTTVNVGDFADEWVTRGDEWYLRARSISPAFPVAIV